LVTSVVLLVAGLGLTISAGAPELATFPQLPIGLLRSSALAGGLVDTVLGGNVLAQPDAFSTVPLHPLVVAGFGGTVINALNLLPIGCTDGGRAASALLGRPGASFVSGFAFLGLLWAGLAGSDLLLFYAAAVSITMLGPEIACRDEVTEVGVSRILVTSALGVVVGLSLLPFPLSLPY